MLMNSIKLIIVFLIVVAIVGCGADKHPNASKDELVILCGNSFLPPTEALIKEFKKESGINATFTTGGSEDLLPHVKAGKMGDVYITHDPYLEYTKKAKAYSDHVYVGFVAPVLAVQKGNPKSIKSINDLTKNDLKVALSNPEYSTCGELVFKLLEKKKIKNAVLKNVGNRLTKGHSNLGNFLKTKAVDAVIMWNGVANTFKDHLEIVKTPYEYDTEINVSVIGLSYSKHTELVKKFMKFTRENGPRIFSEYGYVK
ncbi:MAG: extracellular solute-binding protein [Bacteroidales bacterium]|nr:extracellular solute-binding protein [Bacteroidales bacterium]